MIGKVDLVYRVIQILLDSTIGSPKDSVSVSWEPLLFASVILVPLPNIELIGRNELDFAFIELLKQDVRVLT